MKKIFKFLVPITLLALTLMMTGCGDTNTTTGTTAASNFDFSKTGTLSGGLFNAVTGERIADPNTKIVMLRGADTIQVSKYYSSATDIARGEYAFTGVPVAVFDGNITYRVIVEAPGYQRFEAEATSAIAGSAGSTYDTVYNQIGDIYLFPKGVAAPDYSVAVKYNSKAVPGAIVQLQQNATNNSATAEIGGATSNRLLPTIGLLPTISATTDANGVAVFSGTSLVLGGEYTAVVLPVTTPVADGSIPLARKSGSSFIEGATASFIGETINMTDLNYGTNAAGLYVVSASNSTAGALTTTGVLTLTFNRPVVLNGVTSTNTSAQGFSAALTNAGAAVLNATTTTAILTPTRQVISTLSADGLTLTLTPSFSTAPVISDSNLLVTYSDNTASISPVGQLDQVFSIFGVGGLTTKSGAAVSGVVHVVGPQP
jgi:hypothetical protein